MSENNDFLRTSTGSFRLRADVLALMMKGAGYAAILCFVVLILAWALVGLAGLLPDDSKTAADPTPLSFLLDDGLTHGITLASHA